MQLNDITQTNLLALAGLVVPYVLAIVRQPQIGRRLTAGLAVVLSVGASFLIAQQSGQLDPNALVTDALIVLGVSQAFYRTLGKHLGLPELEAVTNLPTFGGGGEAAVEGASTYDVSALTAEPGTIVPTSGGGAVESK